MTAAKRCDQMQMRQKAEIAEGGVDECTQAKVEDVVCAFLKEMPRLVGPTPVGSAQTVVPKPHQLPPPGQTRPQRSVELGVVRGEQAAMG